MSKMKNISALLSLLSLLLSLVSFTSLHCFLIKFMYPHLHVQNSDYICWYAIVLTFLVPIILVFFIKPSSTVYRYSFYLSMLFFGILWHSPKNGTWVLLSYLFYGFGIYCLMKVSQTPGTKESILKRIAHVFCGILLIILGMLFMIGFFETRPLWLSITALLCSSTCFIIGLPHVSGGLKGNKIEPFSHLFQ